MEDTSHHSKPEMDQEGDAPSPANAQALRVFRFVERGLLIAVTAMTLIAAGIEVLGMIQNRVVTLADILLMFLYTEVIGMIAVFYAGRSSPYFYPIFIAMTALARLIVLQGKDMSPENILFEAGAILLLAVAVLILGKSRPP
jgi:protein PsiE